MFPWVFGFQWTLGNIIFLGAFFIVVTVVAATLCVTIMRSWKVIHSGGANEIRWKSDFAELPTEARACRHELSGEIAHRTCNRGFDCRGCERHQAFVTARGLGVRGEGGGARDAVAGMAIDPDWFYHRGHTWVRPNSDGTFDLGVDPLGKRLVGHSARAVLPPVGCGIAVNNTAWSFNRENSSVRILSPIDGVVAAHGGKDDDWYLKIAPVEAKPELSHLLHGFEVRPWFTREVERLEYLLRQDGVGASLADGGEMVDDPIGQSSRGDWEAICGEMLLEP